MTHHRFRHRTAAAVLTAALASCILTACGSSSTQTGSGSSQEAALQQKRYAAAMEIYKCARRHGVHLPTPTEAGVNVSGVKGRRNEVAVSNCYQKSLKKAAREAKELRATQEAGPQIKTKEEEPPG